jgi:3-methyladenine DNA glycosylase/8-oxoguanine DNA glycosylase
MERTLRLDRPLDLGLTLGPFRHGDGDPSIWVSGNEAWAAFRIPDGPAALHVYHGHPEVIATAWGPGASQALESVPGFLGEHDDHTGFAPGHRRLDELRRRFAGLRLAASGRVLDALVPAILGQKVTTRESWRSYRRLLHAHGEPAPGPIDLVMPPPPNVLAALPYEDYHPLGIERRRAETIRRSARVAARLEAAPDPETLERLLLALPGVGPWTAAFVVHATFGAPDVVPTGDYHLPNTVAWLLAGEPRADDARMLELLEPYRGHRMRVIRLVKAAGVHAPRYGPRAAARSIDRI